ncbi:MAG: outer membrane protein [Gemmatimonas sp.]
MKALKLKAPTRKLWIAALVAAAAWLAAPAAQAQQWTPYTGWYGSASAGWFQLRDNDGSVGASAVHAEFDPGYALTLAGGYSFGNGFRAELEGGYAHADIDKASIGGVSAAGGDTDLWSIYAAGYYDFQTNSGFRPYLGGGIGWVHTDADAIVAGGTRTASGSTDDWSAFAEAGLNIALADNLDLVPGVRYIWYNDSHGGLDDNAAWLFKAGLRYRF